MGPVQKERHDLRRKELEAKFEAKIQRVEAMETQRSIMLDQMKQIRHEMALEERWLKVRWTACLSAHRSKRLPVLDPNTGSIYQAIPDPKCTS